MKFISQFVAYITSRHYRLIHIVSYCLCNALIYYTVSYGSYYTVKTIMQINYLVTDYLIVTAFRVLICSWIISKGIFSWLSFSLYTSVVQLFDYWI